MSKLISTTIIILAISFCSCKKVYICECTSPGGTDEAFRTYTNRIEAKRACEEVNSSNTVAWNETFCKLK